MNFFAKLSCVSYQKSKNFQLVFSQWLFSMIIGAIIIAILGIIFGIISIIGILLVVPFCALMLYGVKSERQGFIIPYLILGVSLKMHNNNIIFD